MKEKRPLGIFLRKRLDLIYDSATQARESSRIGSPRTYWAFLKAESEKDVADSQKKDRFAHSLLWRDWEALIAAWERDDYLDGLASGSPDAIAELKKEQDGIKSKIEELLQQQREFTGNIEKFRVEKLRDAAASKDQLKGQKKRQ